MTEIEPTANGREIDARPTKRFFVRMLVRDIELVGDRRPRRQQR